MAANRVYYPNRKNRFLSKVRKIKESTKTIAALIWYYVSDLVAAIATFALIFLSMLFLLAGA